MFLIMFFVLKVMFCDVADSSLKTGQNKTAYDLGDHTMVSSSNVFPYVAAILNKTRYLCAGALISDSWVLTVADSVYLYRDSLRLIHVHLGGINYKKGGVLLPVKLIEYHPYFDDQKPEYDIALIQLAGKARVTPNLSPIRVQRKPKEVVATHFIVTAWPVQQHINSAEIERVVSMESVERRRMLQVAHLHPMKTQQCNEVLDELTFSKENLMCLDQGEGVDPCSTDVGAPVVLHGILWGLVSSWVPDDCDLLPGPSFVVLASAPNITSWIQATIRGTKWHQRMLFEIDYDDYEEDD